MKKRIIAIILSLFCLCQTAVFAAEPPTNAGTDAYMGFSVSNGWYVLSKNMTDTELLKALDLTAEEVNEALIKADCEYFITNPKDQAEIYVKTRKNAVSEELYNISGADDEYLKGETGRILSECFSVDGFDYNQEDIVITKYPQMKFVTIPGTVVHSGGQHGMIFGYTFVNGIGIAFIMNLEAAFADEVTMFTFSDIAGSVSFTQIKDKDDNGNAASDGTGDGNEAPNPLGYIVGGFAAIAMVILLLYIFNNMKQTKDAVEAKKRKKKNPKKKRSVKQKAKAVLQEFKEVNAMPDPADEPETDDDLSDWVQEDVTETVSLPTKEEHEAQEKKEKPAKKAESSIDIPLDFSEEKAESSMDIPLDFTEEKAEEKTEEETEEKTETLTAETLIMPAVKLPEEIEKTDEMKKIEEEYELQKMMETLKQAEENKEETDAE